MTHQELYYTLIKTFALNQFLFSPNGPILPGTQLHEIFRGHQRLPGKHILSATSCCFLSDSSLAMVLGAVNCHAEVRCTTVFAL